MGGRTTSECCCGVGYSDDSAVNDSCQYANVAGQTRNKDSKFRIVDRRCDAFRYPRIFFEQTRFSRLTFSLFAFTSYSERFFTVLGNYWVKSNDPLNFFVFSLLGRTRQSSLVVIIVVCKYGKKEKQDTRRKKKKSINSHVCRARPTWLGSMARG